MARPCLKCGNGSHNGSDNGRGDENRTVCNCPPDQAVGTVAPDTAMGRQATITEAAVGVDLHIPIQNSQVENTITFGQQLFLGFIRQRLLNRETQTINQPEINIDTPAEEEDRSIRIGTELRTIAVMIERSPQRQNIETLAQNIHGINAENLGVIIAGIFQDDITPERIALFFYFCQILGTNFLKDKLFEALTCLVQVSLNYIGRKIEPWIQRRGGWGPVLVQALPAAVKITATIAVIAFGAALIKFFQK